ncbi:MAG: aminotransferase class I/II-fold pyridoxal phosphate-dependent enzyme [Actinobacteria bacterium]|nr:MAG: aminotransferase class I/II-fold pyridoxal phosphate-dependent enzyme [Actinomycetota bacterium]
MGTSAEMERLRALSGIKWQRWGADVIPAWVADMDFPTAPAIIDALRPMVEAGDFGYNMAAFDDSIPKAWVAWSERRFGWRPDVERTKVFTSTLQPISAALMVATEPGDGVLLLTPVYAPFFGIVKKSGRRLVEYRLNETEWRIDADALRSAIDQGTRAVILCNPHNPSGRAFTMGELRIVAEVAEERDLLVISDEIWQDFVYPGSTHIPFASLGPDVAARCVTVTAASKSFSLGGLSCAVGYLGAEKVAEGIAALAPHMLGGVNALGAHATLAAWASGEEWLLRTVETLRANRDHLLERLSAELPEVIVGRPEATYLAWLDFRATGIADDPAKHLLERGLVGLSAGPEFGSAGKGFARLNFATHAEILDEILDRVVQTVRGA